MKYYVGIDLGTTNSAIASFDGENVRVWKSKSDQNDVTPSAIYIDKRGKKFYGSTAYRKSAQQPERCATLFKRFMGTSTKIKLGDEELLPEECSAEILRELYRNLPEEIRTCDETATVITVPAAFNQMQNAATLEAAKLAGIGHVAVMQEPVAAIMSVMKENDKNAKFLIYDLGGGTLDVAIAECLEGKVNLLAHGGIAMCGGRDFDRVIMDHIVVPWLQQNYDLPTDFKTNKKYEKLICIASYASEIAKLGLSSDSSADIEGETGVCDESGEEIYLDIPITRDEYDPLIASMIDEFIKATRDAIQKAGLAPADMDRIVFVGGPTNYKPIRDKVSDALGIPGSIEVNPMTAVAQGASIYAEAIDWSSDEHGRKSTRNHSYTQASNDLTNPNNRILAEVNWFCGMDNEQIQRMIQCIQTKQNFYAAFPNLLCEFNYLKYKVEYESLAGALQVLPKLDTLYKKITKEMVTQIINATRRDISFPTIQDAGVVTRGIEELRKDVHNSLGALTNPIKQSDRYVQQVTSFAKQALGGKPVGVLIEEFISTYRLDIQEQILQEKSSLDRILTLLIREQSTIYIYRQIRNVCS